MRLSSIFKEMNYTEYELYNEKDFDNMSILLPNRSEQSRCVFLSEKKYIKKLDDSVKMVITTDKYSDVILSKKCGVCVVNDPRLIFYLIHNFLATKKLYPIKSFKTQIGNDCKIDASAIIPKYDIILGNRVIIEDRVTFLGRVVIGDDCIIHSGSVIGANGNDFKRYGDKLVRTSQVGGIKIGNGVEIDQNCCIERPMFPYEYTILGEETKIGALSFIAHGVKIGSRTQIKGMVNIAGYTTIGNDVFVGPGATISNCIFIGDDSHISIGSVVASSILKGKHVTGNFAIEHDKFMKEQLRIIRE